MSILYRMHWKTGNPGYLQMFRFWRRIFAIGFAIGVVAGIVIIYQMGLNWGVFAAQTGPIIAPVIGMEVVTAFFVEAGFIGILYTVTVGLISASFFVAGIGTSYLVKGRTLPFARRSVSIGRVARGNLTPGLPQIRA